MAREHRLTCRRCRARRRRGAAMAIARHSRAQVRCACACGRPPLVNHQIGQQSQAERSSSASGGHVFASHAVSPTRRGLSGGDTPWWRQYGMSSRRGVTARRRSARTVGPQPAGGRRSDRCFDRLGKDRHFRIGTRQAVERRPCRAIERAAGEDIARRPMPLRSIGPGRARPVRPRLRPVEGGRPPDAPSPTGSLPACAATCQTAPSTCRGRATARCALA
jgi:hypothetical protein